MALCTRPTAENYASPTPARRRSTAAAISRIGASTVRPRASATALATGAAEVTRAAGVAAAAAEIDTRVARCGILMPSERANGGYVYARTRKRTGHASD